METKKGIPISAYSYLESKVIHIKKGTKKVIVTVLVFCGLIKIFHYILSSLSLSGPLALIGLMLMILLSLVCTSLLVNERNDENA